MIVQRIQCYHYTEAFTVAFHSPQANRHRADSVIICIDCGAEGKGYGESAPRPYVTGEDAHSVIALITNTFAPVLRSRPFQTIADIAAILDELEIACRQKGIPVYQAALAAVDLALVNALEQSGHIGPKALFPVEHRQKLPFSASIPLLPLKIIEKYFPIVMAHIDIQVIKILIGEDSDANYERVKLIRQLAGHETELRLEMNGKLGLAQVHTELSRLAVFKPSAVEQPLPAGDIDNLRRLRETFGLAIVADESLVRIEDARRLIDAGVCDIFNIKISKCGGTIKSIRIARMAARAGLNCQVGTHVGETELLGRAGRRFARSLPNFDCYGGGSAVLFSNLFDPGKSRKGPAISGDADSGAAITAVVDAGRELVARSRLCADIDLSA